MATITELLRPNNDLAMSLLGMQNCGLMCDISLIGDDSSVVKAHKLVLVAMSPFFHNMYLNGNEFNTFQFKNANFDTINNLVQYLYGNVYAISAQNAREIYPFATLLELTHVTKLCEYFDPSVQDIMFDFSETFIMPVTEENESNASEDVAPKHKKLLEPTSSKRKRLEKALSLIHKGNKKVKTEVTHESEDGTAAMFPESSAHSEAVQTKHTEAGNDETATHTPPARKPMVWEKNVPVYQCEVCSSSFLSLEAVQCHVLTHQTRVAQQQQQQHQAATASSAQDSPTDPLPSINFKFGPDFVPGRVRSRHEEFSLWTEREIIKQSYVDVRQERPEPLPWASCKMRYFGWSLHSCCSCLFGCAASSLQIGLSK